MPSRESQFRWVMRVVPHRPHCRVQSGDSVRERVIEAVTGTVTETMKGAMTESMIGTVTKTITGSVIETVTVCNRDCDRDYDGL